MEMTNKQAISTLKIIVYVSIAVTFLSCKKDWLEAKADKKQFVPSTIKDFQAMLDDFSINGAGVISLNEIASDGHYYTEAAFSSLLPSNPQIQNTYIWTAINQHESITNNTEFYGQNYRNIQVMNIVLDEARKYNGEDKIGLEQVKAQALFHRGRLHFGLAQTFAAPYRVESANSDMGLALRLSSDILEPSVRATVKQTYDQIISDLIDSRDILPNIPEYLSRASKPAVLGMLAKVYLSIGDFPNAFKYANEYLAIKNTLLNYNTLSLSSNFIGVNEEIAFFNFNRSTASYLTSQYFIDQTLFDSYDINDLRRQIFFKIAPTGITFKGNYSNSSTDCFFGISTDEMYLIRAEAYARSGNLGLAMKDLNDLVRTRYAKNPDGTTKYLDQSAVSETEALTKILSERKKQLILRNVRWTDLRRLNQDPRFAVTLTRTIGGNTYTLDPNSFRYTFPIPQRVIQASGMPQNTGW